MRDSIGVGEFVVKWTVKVVDWRYWASTAKLSLLLLFSWYLYLTPTRNTITIQSSLLTSFPRSTLL